MKKVTLEQIIEKENANRCESGSFGINACKENIKFYLDRGEDLFTLLGKYVKRANEDMFFNRAMVLACWELINER